MYCRYIQFVATVFLVFPAVHSSAQEEPDPYEWLETVEGERQLAWVRQHNEATLAVLEKHPQFQKLFEKNLEVYNSVDRIPRPQIRGEYIYNFWQDAQHERGLWRKVKISSYLQATPPWEVVLDLDSLSKVEGVKWTYEWATFLQPGYDRCMIALSRGGGDAVVQREYDLRLKQFVPDGFVVSEAKSGTSWVNENTLIVETDFGPGTMTKAGYPRVVKLWRRGSPLEKAPKIFEGDSTDNGAGGYTINVPERQFLFVEQQLTFFTSRLFSMENGALVRLDIPNDASFRGVLEGQLLVLLKSAWTSGPDTFQQGSLVSVDYHDLLRGIRTIRTIFKPTDKSNIRDVQCTKSLALVNVLDNISGELYEYSFLNGTWARKRVRAPEFGTVNLVNADEDADRYFFDFTNFLIPSSLYWVSGKGAIPLVVKSEPAFFDAGSFTVTQHAARSKDGTEVPYFLVAKRNLVRNGQTPVVLTGYGGFEIPMLPSYSATRGYSWLEKGGAFVLANIRGGGEFGPMWHQSVLKENRQKVYDDFIAVAEDLITSKVTSPKHLGIIGSSNGGLLVGVAITQRPDLFGAAVCWVPLLDMRRYSRLLAGASWMDEYGDPDKPEEWAFIRKYSPYHNLFPGRNYPPVFFITNMRDDRVHPAHARKMAAKMEGMGYKDYYYEDIEGGHGTATNKQLAFMYAMVYAYFMKELQ
jgi:prolyl oligopeptidase